MSVELIYNSPVYLVARAVRLCTGTVNKMDSTKESLGPKDKKVIEERILQRGKDFDPLNPPHESVLEHAVYTFHMDFSRAVLQELARHRIASPSVESTRWALKRLLKNASPDKLDAFFTHTGDAEIDESVRSQIWQIAKWSNAGKWDRKPNDIIKYALPEAFKTQVQWTVNAGSLRNWFCLRTSNRALWEIRDIAYQMVDMLPEDHKFLFSDRIHER